MHKAITLLVSVVLGTILSTGSWAGEFGSKEEAVALVKRAIAHVGEVGMDKAVVEFSDPKGKWVDRDLYLIIVDKAGVRIAHGQNVKMIGKSFTDSVDINGKAYGKAVMSAAMTNASGWEDYYFTDPITKKQLLKSAYWEKSGDYIFVCGVYQR